MVTSSEILRKILEFVLYKYPLINALTLLMLFAERASAETEPPIHPRIVYVNLMGFLGCAIFMSSHIRQKEAALVFCGQLIYFSYNFYNNKRLHYKEWLRLEMCSRQLGCVGIYVLFAYILDHKRSMPLRRGAEILIGIFLFSHLYLINNTKEIRLAVIDHIVGGDWGRYIYSIIIAACALSFFAGYFLRDMSVCASVTIATLTLAVDCDFTFWSKKGVHFWNQARMVGDNLCICSGLLYASYHLDNGVKMD